MVRFYYPFHSNSIQFDSISMLSMPCSAHTYSHTYGVCVSFSTICQIELNVRKDEYVMGFPGKCRLSIVVFGAGLKVKIKGSYVVVSRSIRLVYMCFSVAILVLFTNLCWIRISVFVCVFLSVSCVFIRFSFPLVLLLFILYRQITMLQQLQVETIQRFICSVFLVHSGI